jgi:hypothetical protein
MELAQGFDAYGFRQHEGKLAFAKYESAPDMSPFPVRLGPQRCAEIAWDWLQGVPYPEQPDHDGDSEGGWLLRTDEWGYVEGFGYQYFIAVEPMWIMFGK